MTFFKLARIRLKKMFRRAAWEKFLRTGAKLEVAWGSRF